MDPSITVCVATYGDQEWQVLAESRAVPSALPQAPVIRVHGDTLHGARNEALRRVQTERVVFLDSDDELEDGYIEAMAQGTADLRVPSVRYVTEAQRCRPAMVLRVAGHTHACHAGCLPDGNFMVIGTSAPTALLREVGGFEDFDWSEDWALWARCVKAGATVETIPDAVYRAHVRWDSRNRGASQEKRLEAHWAIHRAVWPELYAEAA